MDRTAPDLQARLRVQPVRLAYDRTGTACSTLYRDVYHSRAGAFAQAEHVFVRGARVRERWASRARFVVVETGFGLGVNFLATVAAWQADPGRPRELFYLSVERHPLPAQDLALAHAVLGAGGAIERLAGQLVAGWPQPTPGLHRLQFERGAVTLLLVLDDASRGLRALQAAADAFYLDGFAPSLNPRMWTPEVFKAMARMAAPQATLATWCVAGEVRRNLAAAGFEVERAAGFGGKHQMTIARFAPSWRWSHRWAGREPAEARRAVVVGAGIAGATVAASLARRGWEVTVLERSTQTAAAASGNAAGALHPHLSADDCLRSRATRAAYALARDQLAALGALREGWAAEPGMLDSAGSATEFERIHDAARWLEFPEQYARPVSAAEAADRLGTGVAHGGWWLRHAAWVRPRDWVARCADQPGVRIVLGGAVNRIGFQGHRWLAFGPDGGVLASAPVMVLANGDQAVPLLAASLSAKLSLAQAWPLRRVKGQVTLIRPDAVGALRAIVSGAAYALPYEPRATLIGATYEYDDDPGPTDAADRSNLTRLARVLGREAASFASADVLGRRVGFRSVAQDRMPMIGALADAAAAVSLPPGQACAGLDGLPRLPGLWAALAYGSRGLTWAVLGAEVLASAMECEPAPAASDVLRALDPGRFLLRALRTGRLC